MNSLSTLKQAQQLRGEGRFQEALSCLEAEAERLRQEPLDIVPAVSLSLEESLLLHHLGLRELSIARATWVVTMAQRAEHKPALSAEPFSVLMGFFLFANAAGSHADADFASIHRVLDVAEALVNDWQKPGWESGVYSERASLLRSEGRDEESLRWFEQAIALKRRYPGAPGHSLTSLQRSYALALSDVGQVAESDQVLDELAEQELRPIDRLAVQVYSSINAFRQEHYERAHQLGSQAITTAQGLGPQQALSANFCALKSCAMLGLEPQAKAYAEEARVQALLRDRGGEETIETHLAFLLALAAGDRSLAQSTLHDYAAAVQRRRNPDAARRSLADAELSFQRRFG